MSEIKNGVLGLYGAEHSKCDGTGLFKGLTHTAGNRFDPRRPD